MTPPPHRRRWPGTPIGRGDLGGVIMNTRATFSSIYAYLEVKIFSEVWCWVVVERWLRALTPSLPSNLADPPRVLYESQVVQNEDLQPQGSYIRDAHFKLQSNSGKCSFTYDPRSPQFGSHGFDWKVNFHLIFCFGFSMHDDRDPVAGCFFFEFKRRFLLSGEGEIISLSSSLNVHGSSTVVIGRVFWERMAPTTFEPLALLVEWLISGSCLFAIS